MRFIFQLCLLAFAVAVSGCAGKPAAKSGGVTPPPKRATSNQPVVKPSNELTGKVISFNAVGRFGVLNFPVTHMPVMDQTLFLYRAGLKVGEVKITGPQRDDNIVADLIHGEARAGDEVRDR